MGLRLALVGSSHCVVLLVIGLGGGCLGPSIDSMGKNGSLLPAMLEVSKLMEKERECWTEIGRNCQWGGLGNRIGLTFLVEGALE